MAASSEIPASIPDDRLHDLLQFLREENEANRQAVRDDAEASRNLLRFTVWLVGVPITALILIVGWFGFRSVTDLKQSLERQANETTKAEVGRMQDSIRLRLNTEFETPRLQQMVRTTAAEYTKNAAEPLIKNEVLSQVRSRVDVEEKHISAMVTQQTRTALEHIQPQINTLVTDSVNASVQRQVEPVAKRMQEVKGEADLESLIIKMNNDDAIAFDELIALASTSQDANKKQLIEKTVREVAEDHSNALRLSWNFNVPRTEDETLAALTSSESSDRMTALSILAGNSKLALSRVVELATTDPSLKVRCEAGRVFGDRTKQRFNCLYRWEIAQYWASHKQ